MNSSIDQKEIYDYNVSWLVEPPTNNSSILDSDAYQINYKGAKSSWRIELMNNVHNRVIQFGITTEFNEQFHRNNLIKSSEIKVTNEKTTVLQVKNRDYKLSVPAGIHGKRIIAFYFTPIKSSLSILSINDTVPFTVTISFSFDDFSTPLTTPKKYLRHLPVSPHQRSPHTKESPTPSQTIVEPEKILADYGQLLVNPYFSDVIFSCQGQKLNAHKAILAVRCKSFLDYICQSSEETKLVVQVDDIKPEVMKIILQNIYTGSTEGFAQCTKQLLDASVKFRLPMLQQQCETILCGQIQLDSVLELYELVNKFDLPTLQKQLYAFIEKNFKVLVKDNVKFGEQIKGNQDLLFDIMKKIF